MNYHPRFTVAIPTYNRCSTFLPQAIDGVLQQSFTDFELIVSDNGSSDGTEDYVRSLKDPRIRFIRHDPTIHAGKHFKSIAKKAVGELYVMHQDDDLLHQDFLARADVAFSSHPEAIIYSSPIWRQLHGHGYHSRLMRHREGHDDMKIIRDELTVFEGAYAATQFFDPIRQFLHPTLAVRTDSLLKIGGYDSGGYETDTYYYGDLVTQARLLFHGPMIYDPRVGGVSRVHPTNFMRTKNRAFRKMFHHNSYLELIKAFDQAGVCWQGLLNEYLDKLSEKEILSCLFEWTYYRTPLELQHIGFSALRDKAGKRFARRCLTKLGPRNLVRHWYSHLSKSGETSWSTSQ